MSAQIIIPGPQAKKKSDIYVMVLTKDLEVCSASTIVCIVSTKVDGDGDPLAELLPGIALLGAIKERFDSVVPTFEPIDSGLVDRCFISKSYDDSSHFKSAAEDVLSLYEVMRPTSSWLSVSLLHTPLFSNTSVSFSL
jgi:Rab GDP dissociation inhibitor